MDQSKKKNKHVMQDVSNYALQASVVYDDLLIAMKHEPDYKYIYNCFGQIFQQYLYQNTNFIRVGFSGTFARTDYLLKEHKATVEQSLQINAMRIRLRKRATLSYEELRSNCRFDLFALAEFVSLVSNTKIPLELYEFKSACQTQTKSNELVADAVRMIVDSWDQEYIYGKIDKLESKLYKVKIKFGDSEKQDWSYLVKKIYVGAQLNLVRAHIYDKSITAELIIFEPDILIDISAISKCFNEYGSTANIHLLEKIKPRTESTAILIGNLASQFLDDEIHANETEKTFNKCIKDFYFSHPLDFATSSVSVERDFFYKEALIQRQNISNAIGKDLPTHVNGFNHKEVILEPSFISEMLGLQGRMDFLTLDKSLIIEQKSGRCGFPQQDKDTPVHTIQHYIQVLLYMLIIRYNYSSDYKRNGGLRVFLLYSKYKNSLLGESFAPDLVFKAIKMRNEIAYNELMYARHGFEILNSLTSNDFLTNTSKSEFFNRYIRPEIDGLLNPIHNASTIERLYFYRYMRFIAVEHVLSKIGSQTKAGTGFASLWNESLEDKLQAGDIYDNLTIEILPQQKKIEEITLHFHDSYDNDMSNFRVGDIVILYPYEIGREPDARKSIVFRCTIAFINTNIIRVKLRAPQTDATAFTYKKDCCWAIEHDFIEASFSSLYRGMHLLLTAPKERRELLLSQRKPRINKSLTLNGNYGKFNDLILKVKQAQDFYLIMGPPGTGKTSFGLLNTLREELSEQGTSILLMSFTNRAVDEICSKLVSSHIDFIRIGSELSCADEYKQFLLSEKVKLCPHITELIDMIRTTRVFVGTTTALNSSQSIFNLKSFDLALIDEASQILEPQIIGLLSAHSGTECAIKKFVLIGDHKQLPAVVQQNQYESLVEEKELKDIGITNCRNSLFQRLYETYGDNTDYAMMLTHQGRMHHDIALFPNHWFYENKLKEVPLAHQLEPLEQNGKFKNCIENIINSQRVAFISVSAPQSSPSDKVNQNEADVITKIIHQIYLKYKEQFNSMTVGVIVPYRNQIATIRNTIGRLLSAEIIKDITIDTVERFQGSQRDYIIYGFTVSRLYQLDFLTSTNFIDEHGCLIDRKLNVAMTRAKKHLIIVGDKKILQHNAIYAQLIDFIKQNGCYLSII